MIAERRRLFFSISFLPVKQQPLAGNQRSATFCSDVLDSREVSTEPFAMVLSPMFTYQYVHYFTAPCPLVCCSMQQHLSTWLHSAF